MTYPWGGAYPNAQACVVLATDSAMPEPQAAAMDERDVPPDIAADPGSDSDDDVAGHRFLTPDQAQAQADRARDERAERRPAELPPVTTDDQT